MPSCWVARSIREYDSNPLRGHRKVSDFWASVLAFYMLIFKEQSA
jgi:hypothetical protein